MPAWVIFFVVVFVSANVLAGTKNFSSAAAGLSEPMCRQQAKDLAKKRYDLCMKKVKQAEIKKLHQQYQQRIESIKKEYQDEINKLKDDGQEDIKESSKEDTEQRPAPRRKRRKRRHKVA